MSFSWINKISLIIISIYIIFINLEHIRRCFGPNAFYEINDDAQMITIPIGSQKK